FVVGSQVVRHPGIVRQRERDGCELGNHTFTHSDVGALPGWRRSLELRATDAAVAAAAGVRPRLMRPPYSSTPREATGRQARAFGRVAGGGYVITLTDLDARDWDPSRDARAIAAAATPKGREGGFVLMHDGGGDRARTVAALPKLVAALRSRGFELVTASEIAGLSRAQAELPATSGQRLRGQLLIGTLAVARTVTDVLTFLLGPIAILMLLRALVMVVLARRHTRRRRALPFDPAYAPSASILVPAYNEAVGIEAAVRSFAASEHPDFEVIVIDDGSSDGTPELVERLALPNVRVLRQANGGKPAALNRGLAAARNEVVVMVDADTVFEPQSLRRVIAPLSASAVGAVSGNTKVGNRRGLLGRWQHIEYVMGFNLDRRLYDVLRCMPTVPGAIGAFRRQALQDVGGLSSDTLAEDTDLTLAIGRAGWDVVYAEEAIAWTEAPPTLNALWRQRYRWSYGTMQAVWKHRAAVVRRGEGRIGRRAIPYMVLFQVALPMLAPLIDLFALYGILFLDPIPVIGYWVAFNLVQLGLAAYAFRLDHESWRPLWAMPLQQFVYRQLMYLVVIESVISAVQGKRLAWQHIERRGEMDAARP
ncbi:MAG TPA: bifunctional polysaccharide deacetylase/glycosyltransferase family 2 protein, partial [Solirubrobacteraceae bacterium]